MATKAEEKRKVKEYNHKYYLENRAEIRRKRRTKYASDEGHRQRVLDYEREWREARRRERFEERVAAADDLDPFAATEGSFRFKVVALNGEPVQLFSSAVVAAAASVKPRTICVWIDRGFLPPPQFISEDGRRWFSRQYIDNVRKAAPHRVYGLEQMSQEVQRLFEESPA